MLILKQNTSKPTLELEPVLNSITIAFNEQGDTPEHLDFNQRSLCCCFTCLPV